MYIRGRDVRCQQLQRPRAGPAPARPPRSVALLRGRQPARADPDGHDRRDVGEWATPKMSVEDIVRGAGVSRRTFYELFANKHEAFLAAFDAAAGALLHTVETASEQETTFEGKVIAGFRAFVETLAATPGTAQVCIVEALAAGPDAIERRTAVMASFAAGDRGQRADGRRQPPASRADRGDDRRRRLRGDLPADRGAGACRTCRRCSPT